MIPTHLKKTKDALGGMVTVLSPEDALQPILPVPVRAAVHQWMTEIRAEEDLKRVKVEPRRTALLSGPPGCGKTTLAHHLAARLNYDLICVAMDRLRSQYVGQTGQQIADLFDFLKSKSDTIVLFDEFDALAAARSNDEQASSREANNIVNSLLQRIEGYQGILIAATNRADAIDPAIWRRFGMQLEIPLPGEEERFAIIKLYLDPYDMDEEQIDTLSKLTEGASPSLLRQLIEGLKRDLVLAPRLNLQSDPLSVFLRVMASVSPHSSYTTPPLWEKTRSAQNFLKEMKWPLELKKESGDD